MRDKLESVRDMAEETERKARWRYIETGSWEDMKRKRDAQEQLDNLEDTINELDDTESELDD